MQEQVNIWGWKFEPSTGRVYDMEGKEQAYTFQNVAVLDQHSGRVFAGNPLQFATRDTAEKMLEYLRGLKPGMDLKLHETVWTAGPFLRPTVEYGIETPSGTVMNAGLVANTLMRSGPWADNMLRAELGMYK